MSMLSSSTTIAINLANSLGGATPEPWINIFNNLATHISMCCSFVPGLPPDGLVAVGAAVQGIGRIGRISNLSSLAFDYAIASGASNSASVDVWSSMLESIQQSLENNCMVNPALLIASPTGGPISGIGTVQMFNDIDLAYALLNDANTNIDGLQSWQYVSQAISALIGMATALPIAMFSPNGGGPVTGVGILQ